MRRGQLLSKGADSTQSRLTGQTSPMKQLKPGTAATDHRVTDGEAVFTETGIGGLHPRVTVSHPLVQGSMGSVF